MSAFPVANNNTNNTTRADADQQDNNSNNNPNTNTDQTFEILVLTKHGGPLTKQISLGADGKVKSDGSLCRMSRGTAIRETLTLPTFAPRISALEANQAIALGSLPDGTLVRVRIETKKQRATRLPDDTKPDDLICRSEDDVAYKPSRPALALIDVDTKAMPPAVAERIRAAGGFWNALTTVVRALEGVGRVSRQSTTTGLSRRDTGASLAGSDGQHIFVLVEDGADIKRFLYALHDRCWLAGFG